MVVCLEVSMHTLPPRTLVPPWTLGNAVRHVTADPRRITRDCRQWEKWRTMSSTSTGLNFARRYRALSAVHLAPLTPVVTAPTGSRLSGFSLFHLWIDPEGAMLLTMKNALSTKTCCRTYNLQLRISVPQKSRGCVFRDEHAYSSSKNPGASYRNFTCYASHTIDSHNTITNWHKVIWIFLIPPVDQSVMRVFGGERAHSSTENPGSSNDAGKCSKSCDRGPKKDHR